MPRRFRCGIPDGDTYFLVLDRFSVGNPQKDCEDDEMFDATHQDWRKYWAGDLQGVMDRIPYLHPLGATAVWTTPLFEQVESMTCGEQKGSAESKDPDDVVENEAAVRNGRTKAGFLYRNSLVLAFVALFLVSVAIHAAGGLREENENRADLVPILPELAERISGKSTVLLSIFLRQNRSPESKPVTAADTDTGG